MNKSAYDFDQEIARACARLRELADGNLAPSTRTYNAQRGDCRTSDYFNQHGYPYGALVALAGLVVCIPGRFQPGAAAGLRIRRGNGIAPDLTGLAAPAIPDVRIVMDDAPGSALTGNVFSETPPPTIPPARSLAEIEADPHLPRPQRDPLTGQLIPPRDAAGHAVWRVRVYGADERTCAMCGETFTPRIVRNSHGAPKEICYCERCGVEGKDGSGAPVAAPNVRTLAYLQDDEAEIVAMAPA